MTTDEAYDEVLVAVEELRMAGVWSESKPAHNTLRGEGIERYKGPERVKPDKWIHVIFRPDDVGQSQMIEAKISFLRELGIHFDTGGGCGQRDWDLDWSFYYKPN